MTFGIHLYDQELDNDLTICGVPLENLEEADVFEQLNEITLQELKDRKRYHTQCVSRFIKSLGEK